MSATPKHDSNIYWVCNTGNLGKDEVLEGACDHSHMSV